MLSVPYYRGVLSYPNKFTSDNLTVIVNNGTPITIPMVIDGVYGTAGIPDSAHPIRIIFENGVNYIDLAKSVSDPMLPDVGDYNVKIQGVTPPKVETTECFKKAVKSVNSMMLKYSNGEIRGATWQEAYNALHSDIMAFLNASGEIFPCSYFDVDRIVFGRTYIDGDDGVCTNFYSWNPDGTVTYTSDKYPSQS